MYLCQQNIDNDANDHFVFEYFKPKSLSSLNHIYSVKLSLSILPNKSLLANSESLRIVISITDS